MNEQVSQVTSSKIDLRELPMFVVGVVLLAVLLFSSFNYPSLQYNVIWMSVLSLNLAIVMAFLPFSAEFTIPSWAKFGGSAAILIACMYLTFDMAAKGLQKENDELRKQVQDLGGQNATLRNSVDTCAAKSNDQKAFAAGIGNILASINLVKNNVTVARQHAFGATTNTSDTRGCTNAANLSMGASDAALKQIDATIAALNALPN